MIMFVSCKSNTLVASANCALYCGAKIDFVDIDPKTSNIVELLQKKLKKVENRPLTKGGDTSAFDWRAL